MQRNPQNQIKVVTDIGKKGEKPAEVTHGKNRSSSASAICHACGTEVPPKPGFRLSALKCPKCSALMGKK